MIIVMGLGNPGPQYSLSAHNIGFKCIDIIKDIFQLQEKTRQNYIELDLLYKGKKIKFIKPMTFMNLSGQVFSHLRNIEIEKLIIFCDNIDLAAGKVRFHYQGSNAGHNGLKSIISLNPKGNDFYRVYIGVGREVVSGVTLGAADSVLRAMSERKIDILNQSCRKAVDIIMEFIELDDFNLAKSKCSQINTDMI